ncbi:MAG: hypothetical protein HY231_03625 [Acidobacteria bacterium]|nr:hypothetical protein [Acidobacteriota bacterium]
MIFNSESVNPSPVVSHLARSHRLAAMIVLIIGFSVGMYIAIGLLIIGTARQAVSATNYQMPFLTAAGILAFASIAYRRAQFGRVRLEVIATLRGLEGLIKHFTQTTLIAVAIAEIIGLLALLIVFFGGSQRDVVVLGLVAGFVVFTNYPRRDAWLKTVKYFAANLYDDEAETRKA